MKNKTMITINLPMSETINISLFAKLSLEMQCKVIHEMGIFLENFQDKESNVLVYYVAGFFVELTIKEDKTIEILPYRKGYNNKCFKEKLGANYKNALHSFREVA
jgi:hypothetical protein